MNIPLTVYGTGGQQRGFLDIRDTMKCVQIAAELIQEMADAISPFLDKVNLRSIDPKTKWVL